MYSNQAQKVLLVRNFQKNLRKKLVKPIRVIKFGWVKHTLKKLEKKLVKLIEVNLEIGVE